MSPEILKRLQEVKQRMLADFERHIESVFVEILGNPQPLDQGFGNPQPLNRAHEVTAPPIYPTL